MKRFVIPSIFFLSFFVLGACIGIKTTPVEAQTKCANITSVRVTTAQVESKKEFQCIVSVDSSSRSSRTIACGLSFDGGFPQNFCPSDAGTFGGWDSSGNAIFRCVIPNTNITEKKVEAVGYDFQSGCGPDTGKRTPVTLKVTEEDRKTATRSALTQVNEVKDILTQGLSKLSDALQNFFNQNSSSSSSDPNACFSNAPGDASSVNSDTSIDAFFASIDAATAEKYKAAVAQCSQNRDIYDQASQATGVPWQVLAGIHYREGGCSRSASLVSGRAIGTIEPDVGNNCSTQRTGAGQPIPIGSGCGFKTILDSAIYAGNHLKSKINGVPATLKDLTIALSRYNGGGNSNCGKTPYSACPKQYEGEDDTYVLNHFDDRHATMYIVYCADYTKCNPPKKDDRIGAATAALLITK